ncbi:MAG: ATP-binding cassette domain-containing protein [Planctomycetota bacterium]
MSKAVETRALTRLFGERRALDAVDLAIEEGEIFALLGPNGGGKSTLFRILSTLLRPTEGSAEVFGHDVLSDEDAVRGRIGVAFQSASLDRNLTVFENLACQGNLYGLGGAGLRNRIDALLERFKLGERRSDRVGTLSGGLARRVELAKAMIHEPSLLLLDEPSTGLDPGSRRELWQSLVELRARDNVTVLMTTHILEEADGCDRVGILHLGKLIAVGTPGALKSSIQGGVITIETGEGETLLAEIQARFGVAAKLVDSSIRIEKEDAHDLAHELASRFQGRIDSITVGRPTLEDVFLELTGYRFYDAEAGA